MDAKKFGFHETAKKAVVVALVGILSVSCLAGCSSTKKQQSTKPPVSQSQQAGTESNKKAGGKDTGSKPADNKPTNNNEPTKNNPLNKNGKKNRR